MKKEKKEIKHTAHATYRRQYQIVFVPKFRRKEIYGKVKKDIGEILRKLCEQKKVEIIEAEACIDHIPMLVCIPPYLSVSQFMGYLKGKSSLMLFDRPADLKYKYVSRHFWRRGYHVDTVGRNKKTIAEYLKNRVAEECANDQLTLREYIDPFTDRIIKQKQTAARERLFEIVMRCQTFNTPAAGVKPVIAPFRGCANHPFNGWF